MPPASPANFLIVQSTGGLFDVERGAERPASGCWNPAPPPASSAPRRCAISIGLKNAIAFDMGGTTAKAGVIYDGNVLMTGSALIGGYATGLPVQMPMIDIQEVGTGGGSIARVEVGNALRVGPESAGAQPGPVCYGLGGTEPTITDANLMLGRLGADRFLGGEMRLDLDARQKRARPSKIATPLGLDPIEAAEGILRIATTKMAHVVRWVTTERGLDAADFALVAYGGAGPLHAADGGARAAHRARSSSRARPGISPPTACWSPTCGAISSTPGSRRWPRRRSPTWKKFSPRWRRAGPRDRQRRGQTLSPASRCSARADMRYVGQEHAVTVELPIELFTDAGSRRHQAALRCRAPDALRLFGRRPKRPRSSACAAPSSARCASRRSSTSPRAARSPTPAAFRGKRAGLFRRAAGFVDTPTYDRPALLGRQPHRRTGADRGACLDHRRASRRRGRGRCLRRSRHRRFGGADDGCRPEAQACVHRPSRRSGHRPKSCATVSSPRPRR